MWFWYALGASALWGIGYVINQILMRSLTSIEILLVESFMILVIFIPWLFFNGTFKPMLLKLTDIKTFALVICGSIIYISAAILILTSIGASNATLAAIIEASYPIFTMIFAYLLIGEIQFSFYSIVGCVFIITGLVIVHYGH